MTPFVYIKQICDLDGGGTSDALIGMSRAYELALVTYRHQGGTAQYGMLQPFAARVMCIEDDEFPFRNSAVENTFEDVNSVARVTTYNTKIAIEKALLALFSNQKYMSAQQFYEQFTHIYPFYYGNYRIASLFFNLLNGTIIHQ